MSAWTAYADQPAPTNRSILVIAKLKGDNDGVTMGREYLFLAKWDDLNAEFRPVESIASLGRYVFPPDLNIIQWAEVPTVPISVHNQ